MQETELVAIGFKLLMFFVPFLFSLCFHEFAHAFVANKCGDPTARLLGRLSLNPFVHADPIGTIGLPLLGMLYFGRPAFFGWAKPVPVNPRNLRHPRSQMFWIAFAGPLSNLLLGTICAIILGFVFAAGNQGGTGRAIEELLERFVAMNMVLAFFNLLPVHPLDGGKVLERFIPYRWNVWMLEHQNWILMAVIFLVATPYTGFSMIFTVPANFTMSLLLRGSVAIAQLFA